MADDENCSVPTRPERRSESARRVGTRLRSLRKARNMSLVGLGDKSGLSLGLLSSLERGIAVPTLRSLTALADAFGVPPGWFYDLEQGAQSGQAVLRGGRGRRITLESGVEKVLLNPDLGGNLELLLVTIEPHGSSGSLSYAHGGEEGGHVLEGELELWIEDERYVLEPGDSFAFESKRPHRFANPGERQTKLIWVLTPPLYQGRGEALTPREPGV